MVNVKFIIRKAEEKDLDAIVKLYEKKDDFPYSPFGKEKRNIFSLLLSDKTRYILIGEKNNKICAFVSMKIEHRFENQLKLSAFINDIKTSVDEAEILCAILSRTVAIAMENECTEIFLTDKNINAQSFSVYSICGFKESNTTFIKKL